VRQPLSERVRDWPGQQVPRLRHQLPAVAALDQRPILYKRSTKLFNKERIAFGVTVQRFTDLGRELAAKQPSREQGGFVGRERRQCDGLEQAEPV
jgi:hypothetical protein